MPARPAQRNLERATGPLLDQAAAFDAAAGALSEIAASTEGRAAVVLQRRADVCLLEGIVASGEPVVTVVGGAA